jgi:hypothetical protein
MLHWRDARMDVNKFSAFVFFVSRVSSALKLQQEASSSQKIFFGAGFSRKLLKLIHFVPLSYLFTWELTLSKKF